MRKLMLLVLIGCISLMSVSAQSELTQDPTGSYQFELPQGWTLEEGEGYLVVSSPNDEVINVLSVEDTDDMQASIDLLWEKYDPSFDTSTVLLTQDVAEDQLNGFEKGIAVYYADGRGADGLVSAGGSYVLEGRTYPSLLITTLSALQRRLSQVQILSQTYGPVTDATDEAETAVAQPWNDDMSAALTDYMETALPLLDTAGAAIAVVQDGEIVYAQGFGVTGEAGGAVNADTNFLIASMTKSMTTLAMAQAVDDGLFAWDTPVIEVLPTFAVVDPEITQTITMQDLVCACSGVPRRDFELILNTNSAEDILASLATFDFFTAFGEAFQYSNQLVAAAGYITTIARGSDDNLFENYSALLAEGIFEPLGMDRTSAVTADIEALGNVALPYGQGLEASVQQEIAAETWLEAIAPSGGVWSNVNDMARYLQMELNRGELDGTRIVSEDNLAHTWEPQVAVDATTDYGLGWILNEYQGNQVVFHNGNGLGYSSEMSFMPDAGLGIVVLVNRAYSPLPGLAAVRAAQLIFDQEDTTTTATVETQAQMMEYRQSLDTQYQQALDTTVFEPFVGTWTNDALGELTISLADGDVIADFGEYRTRLWQYLTSSTEPEATPEATPELLYVSSDAPLAGQIVLRFRDGEIVLGNGAVEYTFTQP